MMLFCCVYIVTLFFGCNFGCIIFLVTARVFNYAASSFVDETGKHARIRVTIHEKIIVSSNINATFLPRLWASLAFTINGRMKTTKTIKITLNSGVPIPNIFILLL